MKKTTDLISFNIISYVFIGILSLFCMFPFLVLLMSSFTSERYILNHGYTLFPEEFSLNAYLTLFTNSRQIISSYMVTIFITIIGTSISLFVATMSAYVMYRKDLKYRDTLTFIIYFTTLFSGGLAPYYIILTKYFHMKNTVWVLLLVPMFSAINILILRNFISGSIPDSLVESAKIDGAGDFRIFIKIILPLAKPAMASIGLFTALGYWNDWWTAMMFIDKQELFPLQYTLYLILSSAKMSQMVSANAIGIQIPQETMKVAMTVVSTGPILLAYPFVQKHFVKGITIGAVKG